MDPRNQMDFLAAVVRKKAKEREIVQDRSLAWENHFTSLLTGPAFLILSNYIFFTSVPPGSVGNQIQVRPRSSAFFSLLFSVSKHPLQGLKSKNLLQFGPQFVWILKIPDCLRVMQKGNCRIYCDPRMISRCYRSVFTRIITIHYFTQEPQIPNTCISWPDFFDFFRFFAIFCGRAIFVRSHGNARICPN